MNRRQSLSLKKIFNIVDDALNKVNILHHNYYLLGLFLLANFSRDFMSSTIKNQTAMRFEAFSASYLGFDLNDSHLIDVARLRMRSLINASLSNLKRKKIHKSPTTD